jgi:hypothetical protein
MLIRIYNVNTPLLEVRKHRKRIERICWRKIAQRFVSYLKWLHGMDKTLQKRWVTSCLPQSPCIQGLRPDQNDARKTQNSPRLTPIWQMWSPPEISLSR